MRRLMDRALSDINPGTWFTMGVLFALCAETCALYLAITI